MLLKGISQAQFADSNELRLNFGEDNRNITLSFENNMYTSSITLKNVKYIGIEYLEEANYPYVPLHCLYNNFL